MTLRPVRPVRSVRPMSPIRPVGPKIPIIPLGPITKASETYVGQIGLEQEMAADITHMWRASEGHAYVSM